MVSPEGRETDAPNRFIAIKPDGVQVTLHGPNKTQPLPWEKLRLKLAYALCSGDSSAILSQGSRSVGRTVCSQYPHDSN